MTSPITRIALATVWVSDQAAAVRFYTEVLGFEIRRDQPQGDDRRWIEVAPPGGQTALTVAVPSQPDHPMPGGRTDLILACDDIEAAYSDLGERGVHFEGPIWRMEGGPPPMAFFQDPDENRFLLVQRSA